MKNKWSDEYKDFLNDDLNTNALPNAVKNSVNFRIQKLMNPHALMVFMKIFVIHLAVGFLSLAVCHQFGINPFNTEKSLAEVMMSFGGHNFCMVGCGLLFVSLSVLAAGLFLNVEEINALKRTEFLQTLSLGVISLGLFAAFGTDLALGVAALWLLGSLIGGFAATETVWRLKQV